MARMELADELPCSPVRLVLLAGRAVETADLKLQMQVPTGFSPGREGRICTGYPAPSALGVLPRATEPKQNGGAMRCKHDDCTRRAYTSGWCSTHYRRMRSGQPMDAPIRRYVRHEDGTVTTRKPLDTKPVRRKRERPFAAEYALLAELGLGRH
jgi:hypothetical protein